ncbi:hypothetical protein DBR42_06480 [Pelomonas sp. HMWF004]|nr:hypothetical protein DBR42_06480 [Pelomonas sp. HMWF004]
MKALFAAAALGLAANAFAGSVSLTRLEEIDLTGDGQVFSETGLPFFTLSQDTWVSGVLNTAGFPGTEPSVDISAVSLKNLTTGEVFSWTELLSVDWNADRVGLEQWGFAPRLLAAGSWSLDVAGTSYSNTLEQGFTATAELPEPGSAGLAVAAVAGALLARRRRKAD